MPYCVYFNSLIPRSLQFALTIEKTTTNLSIFILLGLERKSFISLISISLSFIIFYEAVSNSLDDEDESTI